MSQHFFLTKTKCQAVFTIDLDMVFSSYKKQRILYLNSKGLKAPAITRILSEEGMEASRVGTYKCLKKFEESGCLMRKPGSGRPSKITEGEKRVVEGQMRLDYDTTAFSLHESSSSLSPGAALLLLVGLWAMLWHLLPL